MSELNPIIRTSIIVWACLILLGIGGIIDDYRHKELKLGISNLEAALAKSK